MLKTTIAFTFLSTSLYCAFPWLALTLLCGAANAAVFDVLLIGNSYTAGTRPQFDGFFANDPLNSANVTSITPGGWQLIDHFETQSTLDAISNNNWDYIILQDQSLTPSIAVLHYMVTAPPLSFADWAEGITNPDDQDGYHSNTSEEFWAGITNLSQHIAEDSSARVLYYSTWARHPDDTTTLLIFPPVNDPDAQAATMLSYNDFAYEAAQAQFSGISDVAYVGDAWAESYSQDPSLRLHGADNSHGSAAGYYLSAALLYQKITKKSPVGSTYLGGLTLADATFLQTIAQTSVPEPGSWALLAIGFVALRVSRRRCRRTT